jgi:hypothetical protein
LEFNSIDGTGYFGERPDGIEHLIGGGGYIDAGLADKNKS